MTDKGKVVTIASWFAAVLFLSSYDGLSMAQDVKSSLFIDANTAFKDATQAKADILVPKVYQEGVEFYRKASSDYQSGKKLSDVRKILGQATNRFHTAIAAARVASVAFGTTIQARADAQSAGAPTHAAQLWRNAEEKFSDAATTLQDGNLKDAQRKASDAEKIFRDAELKSIKANYLDETYLLLKEAEKVKAKEFAPNTLKKAQNLVKAAEQELAENRYDTDKARIWARQAKREAKHALYLGLTIRDMKEKKLTWEDLMLKSEDPLTEIAASVDIVASFENGYNKPTSEILKRIEEYQENIATVTNEAYDAAQMNALLEQRNAELLDKLGDVEVARSALAKRMERQVQVNRLYDAVEKLFTGEVAVFIRHGSDIIIRTVGLSFPVGKATIDPKYYDFLNRVGQAIAFFPNAGISVEGHTDSYGSDATNLKLSLQRAEAVKSHLTETLGIAATRIESRGYGESQPVATNETEAGRSRNRRIEIIIHPNVADAIPDGEKINK